MLSRCVGAWWHIGHVHVIVIHACCFAADYGNEAEVGEALSEAFRSGLVKREDLFVTTKAGLTEYLTFLSYTLVQCIAYFIRSDCSFGILITGMFLRLVKTVLRSFSWIIWICIWFTFLLP